MGSMSGVRDQMNNQVNCVCSLCGQSERLSRCGRCLQIYYCSKKHQKQHWPIHKLECFEFRGPRGEQSLQQGGGGLEIQRAAKRVDATSHSASSEQGHVDQVPTRAIDRNSAATSRQLVVHNEPQQTKDAFVSTADDLGNNNSAKTGHEHTAATLGLSHRNNYENSAGFHSLQSTLELRYAPTTVEELGHYSAAMPSVSPVSTIPLMVHPNLIDFVIKDKQVALPPFRHNSVENFFTDDPMKRNTGEWLFQVCQFVVRDLDTYGVCVVDNFLGRERGEAVFKTAEAMYNSGVFREGEVVSAKLKTSRNIRGDKISWVDGTESSCAAISHLISLVDSVIMNARKMKNNGKLGQYQISGRTKAMVACYPGNGTHYVKHVDNPNRDGRCITSIYYLNKDWDVKVDGGLLRIFPEGWTNQVADIEPIFDRLIFFWSDRRNPHEVQPAFRTRYAITLWYFDAKEREEARVRHQKDYGVQSLKSSSESAS